MLHLIHNVWSETENQYCNSIFMIQGLCIILMLWLIIIWWGAFIHRYFMSEILIMWASIEPLWTLHMGFPPLCLVIGQSVIVPCLGTQSHLSDSIFISSGQAHQALTWHRPWCILTFSSRERRPVPSHIHTLLQIRDEIWIWTGDVFRPTVECGEHQFVHKGGANIAPLYSSSEL